MQVIEIGVTLFTAKEGVVHFKPKSIFFKLKELSSVLRILSPGPDNHHPGFLSCKESSTSYFFKIYLLKVALME